MPQERDAGPNGLPSPPLRLGAVLERLEEIRRALDRDDLELEDQMQLYREGCGLAVQASAILENARAEIELLAADDTG